MNALPSSFFNQLLNMDSGSRDERQSFIRGLPSIPEKDVSPDDTCAICQETFLAIIATQEMASVMETPGLPEEDMGVVQLPGCAHRFCRKDIATWVYSSHSTCPACRNEFLPPSMREQNNEDVGASMSEVREMIRLLQLRAPGIFEGADDVRNNPFNEGGANTGTRSEPVEQEDQEYLRRIQEEIMRSLGAGDGDRDQSPTRGSFGMYS